MRLLLPALAVLTITCGNDPRPPFERANEAAASAKFRDAAKLYAQVRTPEAELRLANIEWRVLREHAAARARLERLRATDKAFDAQLELARLAADRADFDAAYAATEQASTVARTGLERRRAAMAQARVVVADAMRNRPADHTRLREAIAGLRAIIAVEGPRLEASRLLARAGLLAGDRAAMLEGVDGYYHVSELTPPPHLIAAAHAELRTAPDDTALARALAGIRFFDEAALVASPGSEIARYAAMLKRMETIANEHYRQIALGKDSRRALKKALTSELKTIWPRLDFDDAVTEMAKRFGGHLITGKTGGFSDAHIAHKVVDRELAVEQKGRKATVRFISLDGVVSNGFQGWRSDGRSGDGGWATERAIYQVRPQYADGALRDWMRVTDEEVSAEHWKGAEAPTPEGLAKRLRRQYLERVLAKTKTRDAFLARVEADTFQSSILMHEGRHAIDQASGESYRTWELEYRAKLSEVGLAHAPRAALASIVGDTIGGDSPHGKANEKLMNELEAWLKTHAPRVTSVNRLDELTDEQIRAAFRSFDPLAKP